ncbi:MAG TPA: hypothetical protein VFO24_08285 [Usitatibacter sp.]|nr:hypothetical protein [Usitatibacter sp.]
MRRSDNVSRSWGRSHHVSLFFFCCSITWGFFRTKSRRNRVSSDSYM